MPRAGRDPVAAIAVVIGCVALACAASFGGPATERTPGFDLECGSERCDPNYYQCSVMGPPHCLFVGDTTFGKVRDAGADR